MNFLYQNNQYSDRYIINELSGFTTFADSYLQPVYFGNSVGIGEDIFLSKTGRTLNFRSLVAGDNISMLTDGTTIIISAVSGGSSVTGSTLYLLKTSFNSWSGTTLPS